MSVFAFVSCSVKSDRSNCPGFLFLSVSGGDESYVEVTLRADDHKHLMHIDKSEGMAVAGVDLSRGKEYSLLCTCGIGSEWDGVIPLGEQMPRLYAFADRFVCDSDIERYEVLLNKHYSRVYLSIKGENCIARVRGNVCGVNLESLAPVLGQFCSEGKSILSSSGNELFCIDIPRQLDSSLMLELISSSDGSLVRSIELGKEFEKMGVNWNEPNLKDHYVDISFVQNDFVMDIQNWTQVVL